MLVCRFCLKLSPEESRKDISTVDGDQFKLILPELDLSSIQSPVICDLCLRLLDEAYTFKTCCLQSEALINSYKEIHGNVNLIEIYESKTNLRDSFDEEWGSSLIEESSVKAEIADDSNIHTDYAYSSFHVSTGEKDSREDVGDINLRIKQEDLNGKTSGSQQLSEKNYKCQQCSANFKNTGSLKRHQSTHFTDRSFNCPICNKMFTVSRYLSDHIRRCHPRETQQKFECKLCKKEFGDLHQMKRHRQEVHGAKTFNCNQCPLRFSAQRYLEQHIDRRHETSTNSDEITTKKEHKRHINHEHKIKKELKFKCPHCEDVSKTFENLQNHVKEQHNNTALYFCKLCARQFETSYKLKEHSDICPEKQFVCQICLKRYEHNSKLITHITLTHTSKNHHELICQTCGLLYKNKMSLKIHIKTQHLGIRRKRTKYTCEVCNKSFSKPTALRRHKLIHEIHTDFLCPVCQQGFKSKYYMHQHINKIHFDKRELTKYICQHCDAEFESISDLNAHKSTIHTEHRCTCDVCGITCCKKSELKVHMRIHTGVKPYTCEECGKTFVQHGSMITHKKSVHSTEKPFSCTYCEKSFAIKGALTKHLEHVHLKDKLEKKFVCTFCSKGFLKKKDLTAHALWHTGERNQKCDVCGKSFVNIAALKRHKLIHSDEKKHACEICSKRFHQKSNVKIHMKVHNKTK